MYRPYLIQRIELRKTISKRNVGVDSYFRFDYMGSAEFEFGALPKALKAMRETKLMKEPKRIKHPDGHVVWYVGPEDLYDTAKKLFFTQLEETSEFRLKELTYISSVFGTSKFMGTYKYETIGWWDIGSVYAFFCKKEHAKKWLKCVS